MYMKKKRTSMLYLKDILEANEYKQIFSIVKNIIDKEDPMGLLQQGSPRDEYNEEIQKIISGLKICDSFGKTKELIYNIFQESFGEETAGNKNSYSKVAKDIFDIKKRIFQSRKNKTL